MLWTSLSPIICSESLVVSFERYASKIIKVSMWLADDIKNDLILYEVIRRNIWKVYLTFFTYSMCKFLLFLLKHFKLMLMFFQNFWWCSFWIIISSYLLISISLVNQEKHNKCLIHADYYLISLTCVGCRHVGNRFENNLSSLASESQLVFLTLYWKPLKSH